MKPRPVLSIIDLIRAAHAAMNKQHNVQGWSGPVVLFPEAGRSASHFCLRCFPLTAGAFDFGNYHRVQLWTILCFIRATPLTSAGRSPCRLRPGFSRIEPPPARCVLGKLVQHHGCRAVVLFHPPPLGRRQPGEALRAFGGPQRPRGVSTVVKLQRYSTGPGLSGAVEGRCHETGRAEAGAHLLLAGCLCHIASSPKENTKLARIPSTHPKRRRKRCIRT